MIRERKKRREHYYTNKDSRQKYSKNYYLEKKREVVNHYTKGKMACPCCGVFGLVFLSVDHVNNNGAEDRKKGLRGYRLYLWIVKNNYPEDYQVLCYNCNQAKAISGICPHEEERQRLVSKAKLEAEK